MSTTKQVTAYQWEDGTVIQAQQFWPGYATEHDKRTGLVLARICWDGVPTVEGANGNAEHLLPAAEVLECGHVVPLRKVGRRHALWQRRVCVACQAERAARRSQ